MSRRRPRQSGSADFRHSSRLNEFLGFVLILGIGGILLAGSVGTGQRLSASVALVVGIPASGNSTVASNMILEAESSLMGGGGPAAGVSLNCDSTGAAAECTNGVASQVSTPSISPAFPTFATPTPRYGSGAANVVSQGADVILLFGGADSSGRVYGDTWVSLTGYSWSNVTSSECDQEGASCPAPRHDAGFVYDRTAGDVVMFGGCGAATTSWTESTPGCPGTSIYGDTWIWTPGSTLGSGSWSQVAFNGVDCGGPGQSPCSSKLAPSPRYMLSMDYDANVAGDVLFGGCGSSTCPLGDTWVFSGGVHGSWSQVKVTGPSPRYGASMVFDLLDGFTLLFGGCGNAAIGCASGALYGDTWSYFSGAWTQQGSCGGPGQNACGASSAPSPRYLALMSCPITDRTPYNPDSPDLTGGTTGIVSSQVLGDYWSYYKGGASGGWSLQTPPWPDSPAPSPRFDGVLIDRHGSDDDRMMFGGTSPSGTSLGDTEYTSDKTGYFQTVWPPVMPSPRAGFSLAYDVNDGVVVLFGGCGKVCPTNETWIYGNCPLTFETSSRLCPAGFANTPSWWNITALSAETPPARTNSSLAYDAADTEMILFGGLNGSGVALGDTWVFTLHTGWNPGHSCGSSCPTARADGGLSSINLGVSPGGVVLFGGEGSSGSLLGDTWYYSNAVTPNPGWTQLVVSRHPSARTGAAIAYDQSDGWALLFGGRASSGPLQDTWELSGTSYGTLNWQALSPAAPPPAGVGDGMTYDSLDNYTLLFQGGSSGTWYYQSSNWVHVSATPPSCASFCPWPLSAGPIAYSSVANSVILFGGWGTNVSLLGYEYSYGGGTWVGDSIANPAPSETAPPPLFGASMTYDPTVGAVVLVGGCTEGLNCHTPSWGTWAFQNGHWTFIPSSNQPADAPDHVAFASMAFEPVDYDAVVLFGGLEATSATLSGSTWELSGSSLSSLSWTKLSVTGPAPRWGASMAYDSSDQYLVLSGGCSIYPTGGLACTGYLGDTWKFTTSWTQLSISGPSARVGAAMSSGSATSGVFLMGGLSGGGAMNDEWEFSGGSWTLVSSGAAWSPRWGAAATFDELTGHLLLFGGFGPVGGRTEALGDTWEESSLGHWAPTGSSETPRGYGSIAFDPDAGGDGWSLEYGGTNLTTWGSFGETSYVTVPSGWVDISEWS